VAVGPLGNPGVLLAAWAALAMGALAKRKIGGINGDVLGATQQLGELAMLLWGAVMIQLGWPLPWWRS
jgi:adenosylcobinamide-GDP ribazoletransferase